MPGASPLMRLHLRGSQSLAFPDSLAAGVQTVPICPVRQVQQHQACVWKLATGDAGLRGHLPGKGSVVDTGVQQQQDQRLRGLSPAKSAGLSPLGHPVPGFALLWAAYIPDLDLCPSGKYTSQPTSFSQFLVLAEARVGSCSASYNYWIRCIFWVIPKGTKKIVLT